jgi:hypothetical protein
MPFPFPGLVRRAARVAQGSLHPEHAPTALHRTLHLRSAAAPAPATCSSTCSSAGACLHSPASTHPNPPSPKAASAVLSLLPISIPLLPRSLPPRPSPPNQRFLRCATLPLSTSTTGVLPPHVRLLNSTSSTVTATSPLCRRRARSPLCCPRTEFLVSSARSRPNLRHTQPVLHKLALLFDLAVSPRARCPSGSRPTRLESLKPPSR